MVIVIATHGYGLAFAANAGTFLVFALALILAGRGAAAEPERRSRVKDGFVAARHSRTIMLMLLMVAAVTVADDPILVLGPALASHLGVSQGWSGWFIAALGAGSVVGSLRPPRHLPSLRLAATALAALGVCMVVFISTPWVWVSFSAALCAGATCLLANSMTRTLLLSERRRKSGQRDGGLGDRLGWKQTAGVDHRRTARRMDRGPVDGDDTRDPSLPADRRTGCPGVDGTTACQRDDPPCTARCPPALHGPARAHGRAGRATRVRESDLLRQFPALCCMTSRANQSVNVSN